MCVDHRRAHIPVAQQFLDRSDVIAVFQKMSGKAMPERVAAGWLHNARVGVLALQRAWHDHTPQPFLQIFFMLAFDGVNI